jgi:hypothetical protein
MRSLRLSIVAVLAGSAVSYSAMGDSQPAWRAMPALNGECRALMVTSGNEAGGNGSPALWAAGDFTQVGALPVGRVARMSNAGVWTSMGNFNYAAAALCEHDGGSGGSGGGGSGDRVYVGGMFQLGAPNGTTNGVCSYNGTGWSLLPAGYMLTWCSALMSYQMPGQPPKLLVSGSPSGGDNYARALGPAGWEDVGGEFITLVDAAVVYDDGSGAELFTANGTFNGVNKFNGTRRATLGGNVYASPHCFVVMGEGASRKLVLGGSLGNAAGSQVAGLAAWNGSSWSGLGGSGWGVFKSTGVAGTVHCAKLWDDGSGEKLWVGGQFVQMGGNTAALRSPAQNIACWDAVNGWSTPTAGGITGLAQFGFYNGVETMAVFDLDGPGGRPPSLVVAGLFTGAGGVPVSNFAVLDAAWCGPADLGRQGGVAKPDGKLDNNDFVAFIDLFFASDVRADLGAQGGTTGHDGTFDNNDFVVFIDAFFAGC